MAQPPFWLKLVILWPFRHYRLSSAWGNLIMTTTEDANKPLVIADGKLAENCDVIQDEADQTQSLTTRGAVDLRQFIKVQVSGGQKYQRR